MKKLLLLFVAICSYAYLHAQNQDLIMHFPFNGNTLDESGNENHAVNYGATLTTDRFGNEDAAFFFDGSSFIKITPNSDLSQMGDYSISLWYQHEEWQNINQNNNTERQYIFDAHANSSTATGNDILREGFVICLQKNLLNTEEKLYLGDIYGTNPNIYWDGLSNPIANNNEWVFVTFQRKGATYELYINGILEEITQTGASTDPSSQLLDMMHNLYIGTFAGNNPAYYFEGYNFRGKIDDINFYGRSLDLCEIDALYKKDKDLIFHFPFNGNTLDESGNGNHAINHGATLTTDRFGNSNSAYSFDGVDDFMKITPVSDLSQVGDYSISLWYNHANWKNIIQSNSTERHYIFDAHASSSTASGTNVIREGFVVTLDYNFIESREYLYLADIYQYSPTIKYWDANLDTDVHSGDWYFITFQRVGNTYEVYVNGVLSSITEQVFANSSASDQLINMMHNLYIGSFAGNNPAYYFKGYNFSGKIDDINFYTRALSQCEIDILYDDYHNQYEPEIVESLITGTVYTNDGVCTNGNVRLYKIGNNSVSFVASTDLNQQGTYSFSGIEKGLYFVQVIPKQGFTNYLPTYSGHSLNWHESNAIIADNDTTYVNIHLKPVPGQAKGNYKYNGNIHNCEIVINKRASLKSTVEIDYDNTFVYVYKNNIIVTSVAVDQNGDFTIRGIEDGEYSITIVTTGIVFKSENISVSEEDITATSLIEVTTVIYPNPAENSIIIEHSEKINTVKILSEDGKVVLLLSNVFDNKTEITIESLSSGNYFIQINNGKLYKLIKK